MARYSITRLVQACSQLEVIAPSRVAELAAEVSAAGVPWTENYSEYQSGGWKTVALYNSDGDPQHNDLEDGAPVPTELALRLPRLRRFIEGLGLSLMWARLLRLEPGACLWEHTDYGASNLRRAERLRLHVPLVTNPEAVLVFPSHTVHLAAGYLWKLSPDEVRHGACNFGVEARLHLILDCYVDAGLRSAVAGERLDPALVREKPAFSAAKRRQLFGAADTLVQAGELSQAEQLFRRTFLGYALGELTSYDLLSEYFESRGDAERAAHWRVERGRFLNTNVPGHPFYQGHAP